MGEKYEALKAHLAEARNVNNAVAILNWDQQTHMPPGGAHARAAQLGTLSRIGHEMFANDTTARLLDDAAQEIEGMDYDSDEASLLRVVRLDYEEAVKLPASLVSDITRATALAHEVWAQARQDDNFRAFQPALEEVMDLTLRVAECLGYQDHPYDALINQYERGISTARVKEIFDEHKPALIKLIAAINANADKVSDAVLHQPFDVDKQKAFGMGIVKAYGYDFNRGRQDVAVHPFCTSFSRDDVRITTRFNPNWLNPALFGTMHEAGHAMYEQGVAPSLEGTPLGNGTTLGVHESQSRMWENIVGRSKPFWSWALPQLQAVFPDQLGSVSLDTFYKAINKSAPSFIRVEADEATYNLHIMLRFEIETEVMAGKIRIGDLPEEWNDRFETFFGITPPSDTLGVLQDVHWSSGLVGYFPTYALGNLLSAQYYAKALKDRPRIADDIANGQFDTLRTWLNENIHRHGRKFTSDELTRRVTGEPIQSRDYIKYLETKFTEVYDL
jgi:carboxypeptidase Taq